MPAALLSRFDVLFIILDKPDIARDKMLSDHVMKLHSSRASPRRSPQASLSTQSPNSLSTRTLHRVLQYDGSEPILPELLRKYIAYARAWVHPRLSREAADVIQEFYLELREKYKTEETTPITTRQLESLVRLAEARARIELREEVTADDALQVVDLMKESLSDLFEDEHGLLDFSRSNGMSESSQLKKYYQILLKSAEQRCSKEFTKRELVDIADKAKLKFTFPEVLEKLSVQGMLLKQRDDRYKLI